MNLTRIVTPAVVVAAVVLAAAPASAQHRGHGGGSTVGRAVPRGGGGPRGAVGPRVYGPRVVGVAPYRFYRPYYAFRPRVSLGFGLWGGYPVAYPYYGYYGYPYGYASPYAYGYPPAYGYPAPYGYGYAASSYGYGAYAGDPSLAYPSNGYPPSSYPAQPAPNSSVGVQPGAASGGVSFEITPETAAVFVDGTYIGTVAEFGPTSQPLGLVPGRHRIELRAQGYRTMVFDAEVTVGQVIPYRGTMQPVQP